ncbi:uncharacterized protein IL334_007187 [Kwoniella shivajii]|uniref:Telomere length regulation protein conserved domain-containing protein n=1 Tax=Kwoniella shivajii TaxID=564305 RepID=A0ABZ1D7Z7_9TREE|nr:hypothetical protein IL334_007187 [Kwoniella shivajii]
MSSDIPEDFASALKSLRDIIRNPTSLSVEDLSFHLSKTLQFLQIDPTSVPPARISSEDIRSLSRYLPSIQLILLNDIIPTFYHALDQRYQESLKAFFAPSRLTDGLPTRRQIALCSYITLPGYLNNPKQGQSQQALGKPSRGFLISILESLTVTYGIDDLYYAIYKEDDKGKQKETGGKKELEWEEAIRSIVGIPAKVGNAIGRWNSEGGAVDVPNGLGPKAYFDRLTVKLETLMYELSQRSITVDPTPIRLVFEKLYSIGLVTSSPSSEYSRTPSLFPTLLPPLLNHLHPPSSSPLLPYPADYLPSIFLAFPSSSLAAFVESLLLHLTIYLIDPSSPLSTNQPDRRIKRAVDVLTRFIGPPKLNQEAWNAITRAVLTGRGGLNLIDHKSQARNRLTVGWIANGDEHAAKAFIETIMDAWTDPKYVKFTLYAQQFNLTHILILSLSLIPPFSPWLIALSHRAKIIMAFQSYLSHPDPSIRRLGMLVAEILSELTIVEASGDGSSTQVNEEIEDLRKGLEIDEQAKNTPGMNKPQGGMKRLRFTGMWDGQGEGREECRWLRKTSAIKDQDAVLDDKIPGEEWLLGWSKAATSSDPTTVAQALPVVVPIARGRLPIPKQSKSPKSKPKRKPKIVMLDPDQLDDPMEGYISSSPSSSRSPSPTPSYLEEVAADPSLAIDATQKKKVSRPVYIPSLVALLKERDKPECIEMALKWGESLIRAKREFGTELAESSVAATLMALGLNDPFHIDGFDESRQGIISSLVACSPKEVAPFLCEQYFNTQFSLQQKSVILTALAMGARELAGLSVPPPTTKKIDFPSKTLPPILHKKYITTADIPTSRRQAIEDNHSSQIEEVIGDVRNLMLSKGAKKGDEVPEIARQRRLRVGSNKKPLVAESGSLKASQMITSQIPSKPIMAYKDIAAEYFIMPLMNRFWQHFKDSSMRESRALSAGGRYRGAGAGMIMSPIALEKFLMTLSILLHASRHSTVFLSVLAPESLELALTIGTSARHSRGASGAGGDGDLSSQEGAGAQIVGSALDLALVALDTSAELDGGRSLSIDQPNLILSVGEWATNVFQIEMEGGEVTPGQGGNREGRIKANAAAVVLKVGEIGEKWGGLGMRF